MKRILSWVLSLLMIIPLTGCHGSQGAPEFVLPENLDTSKKMELTFWAKNDTNKTQTKIYETAINNFEKMYPNISVKMRLYTDYGKIYNDVITNISTRTLPNICITYPDHIATYLTGANVVVPLDDLMNSDKYGLSGREVKFKGPLFDEIVPQFIKECYFNDHYYALPFMRSTEACYINKTYVEKLGFKLPDIITWDFMFKVAEKALKKDKKGLYKVNNQKVLIPIIYKSTDNMMIQMLKQKNAGYSTEDGQIEIFNDTTKDILKDISKHAKTGAFSTFKISSYPANFLNAGQCIFAIDSTAGSTWMGTDAPLSDISKDKLVRFDTAVRPVPQYDENNMQMISQGPSVCIFNQEDPQTVLASWLFTQYLISNDVQINYAETEGYVPVTAKAQNDASYKKYLSKGGDDNQTHYKVKIDATKLLIKYVKDTFTTPVFNGSTSLRDAAGEMIESVTKSVKRNQEVNNTYIEELFKNVTSLYRLDRMNTSSSKELGALPNTAKAMLAILIGTWILIGLYLIKENRRKKQNS